METKNQNRAALSVLTHPLLFSTVVSFLPGVPAIARPLVTQYVAEGFVRRTRRSLNPYRDVHAGMQMLRIVTPLCENVQLHDQWIERVLPEAIAKYADDDDPHGNDSIRVLDTWLRSAAHHDPPQRLQRVIMHRVSEAAAAFGRLGILQWLHTSQQNHLEPWFRSSTVTKHSGFLARLAARHGNVHVLTWLETTYGRHTVAVVLRNYNVIHLVKCNHVTTLQWLHTRELGVMPRAAVHAAISAGYLTALRFLVETWFAGDDDPFRWCPDSVFLKPALAKGHLHIVKYLVHEQRMRYTMHTIMTEIRHDRLVGAKLLLDHRDVATQSFHAIDMRDWIRGSGKATLEVLDMLTTVTACEKLGCSILACWFYRALSVDVVALLLRMSSPREALVALIWTTLYDRATAKSILANARTVLPADAEQFVRAIMDWIPRTLALEQPAHYYTRGLRILTEDLTIDVSHATTSRDLCCTAMVYLLWQQPASEELPAVVQWLLHCSHESMVPDRGFLEMCKAMSSTPHSKACFQTLLLF